MKRVICLILVLICMGSTIAMADMHISVCAVQSGEVEKEVLSVDIYDRQNSRTVMSSVFPDGGIIMGIRENEDILTAMLELMTFRPAMTETLNRQFDGLRDALKDQAEWNHMEGFYTGTLFGYATELDTTDISLSELIRFACQHLSGHNLNEESDSASGSILYAAAILFYDRIQKAFSGTDPVVTIKRYDGGRYVTALLSVSGKVMMTISADMSDDVEKHIIICSRQSGRYYYHEILLQAYTETYCVSHDLYASDSAVYQTARKNTPLYSEMFLVTNEEDSGSGIDYRIFSPKMDNRLLLSGVCRRGEDGYPAFSGTLCAEEYPAPGITLSITAEPLKEIPASGVNLLNADNPEELVQIEKMTTEGILDLLMTILPSLPEGYQDILLSLFCF